MTKGMTRAALFVLAGLQAAVLHAQFTPDELAQRGRWEEFLKTAEIVKQEQITGRQAVTSPWELTLSKDGITHKALWKNARGRMAGFIEGWQYEISAYLLDKALGLGLVPPTVEREFKGEPGSCQFWVDDTMTLKYRDDNKIKMPSYRVFNWNRMTYLQRLWDNLIDNEDRHMNQILITKDWRMILIDHSRSFRDSRTSKKLIYTAKHPEGPKLMSEIPRVLFEKIKALTAADVKAATGSYLTDEEIATLLLRRDLILDEVGKLIKANGEDKTLY